MNVVYNTHQQNTRISNKTTTTFTHAQRNAFYLKLRQQVKKIWIILQRCLTVSPFHDYARVYTETNKKNVIKIKFVVLFLTI